MKKKTNLKNSLIGIAIICLPIITLLLSSSKPYGPELSYCYVSCSEASSDDSVRVLWRGRLDDGWYTYDWYTDDRNPYTLNASGEANCLLSYQFVYLQCWVRIDGDDIGQTQCVPFWATTPWAGNYYGTAIVSATMDYDPYLDFECPK